MLHGGGGLEEIDPYSLKRRGKGGIFLIIYSLKSSLLENYVETYRILSHVNIFEIKPDIF